jgi:hypothetical protein
MRRRIPLADKAGVIDQRLLRGVPRPPGKRRHALLHHVDFNTGTSRPPGGPRAFLAGLAAAVGAILLTRFATETALLAAIDEALSQNDRRISDNGKRLIGRYGSPAFACREGAAALRSGATAAPQAHQQKTAKTGCRTRVAFPPVTDVAAGSSVRTDTP